MRIPNVHTWSFTPCKNSQQKKVNKNILSTFQKICTQAFACVRTAVMYCIFTTLQNTKLNTKVKQRRKVVPQPPMMSSSSIEQIRSDQISSLSLHHPVNCSLIPVLVSGLKGMISNTAHPCICWLFVHPVHIHCIFPLYLYTFLY